jgi:hypothetical protein
MTVLAQTVCGPGPFSLASRGALATANATLLQKGETIMHDRFSQLMIMVAIGTAGSAGTTMSITPISAQAPASSVTTPPTALKTPWGEPDLQGIWKDEFDTPLQRPAKYVNQEFFTEAQRAELDKERAMLVERRRARGDADVTVGLSLNPTGARTSLIVDPPDGRIPALTPEAKEAAAADREFRLALLRATETCKNKLAACAGGKYDPTPSPRRMEPPPRYLALSQPRINRYDGPLLDPRAAHIWAAAKCVRRELPANRTDTRRHLDVLRRGPGAGLAAEHRDGREPTPLG